MRTPSKLGAAVVATGLLAGGCATTRVPITLQGVSDDRRHDIIECPPVEMKESLAFQSVAERAAHKRARNYDCDPGETAEVRHMEEMDDGCYGIVIECKDKIVTATIPQ